MKSITSTVIAMLTAGTTALLCLCGCEDELHRIDDPNETLAVITDTRPSETAVSLGLSEPLPQNISREPDVAEQLVADAFSKYCYLRHETNRRTQIANEVLDFLVSHIDDVWDVCWEFDCATDTFEDVAVITLNDGSVWVHCRNLDNIYAGGIIPRIDSPVEVFDGSKFLYSQHMVCLNRDFGENDGIYTFTPDQTDSYENDSYQNLLSKNDSLTKNLAKLRASYKSTAIFMLDMRTCGDPVTDFRFDSVTRLYNGEWVDNIGEPGSYNIVCMTKSGERYEMREWRIYSTDNSIFCPPYFYQNWEWKTIYVVEYSDHTPFEVHTRDGKRVIPLTDTERLITELSTEELSELSEYMWEMHYGDYADIVFAAKSTS